ncbi:hypothetical protein HPB51_001672 [Rhipicephalus microplus]|uniref:Cytochrome b561 domain-containing protein n=1 Tax=Rhipicephalus microplus TaxID=6941 RepID=A0A9J6EVE1_RHIMP|nr:hypothetical protein HPB51_001672 [Rhipicephalus microplus]
MRGSPFEVPDCTHRSRRSARKPLGVPARGATVNIRYRLLCGFVAFLFPGVRQWLRAQYLPLHVYFGLAIFVLAVATALMGILEKLIFSLCANSASSLASFWSEAASAFARVPLTLFAQLTLNDVSAPGFPGSWALDWERDFDLERFLDLEQFFDFERLFLSCGKLGEDSDMLSLAALA